MLTMIIDVNDNYCCRFYFGTNRAYKKLIILYIRAQMIKTKGKFDSKSKQQCQY